MFRKKPAAPTVPPAWMIVGLGNPGGEYAKTRHNVGFEVIELLASRYGARLERQGRARVGSANIDGVQVLLVEPLTFMNLSGNAVGPLARKHGIRPGKVLVVADDLDLPTG